MRKPAMASIALVALFAAPAFAQDRDSIGPGHMREGMPSVNPPAYKRDPAESSRRTGDDFARWSRSHHAPKILLFWNIRFSDEASTRARSHDSEASFTVALPGAVVSGVDRISEQQRVTGGPAATLAPADDNLLESVFVSRFVKSGAHFVDRAALMRRVSTRHDRQDRSDQQFIESLAVEEGVDYLVEVLPQYDAASPTGMTFSVKITHVPSSRIRGQFRTQAVPQSGPEQLVARAGGYVRERDSRNTPTNVADTLAAETMAAMLSGA